MVELKTVQTNFDIHPGLTLDEHLEFIGMTQAELARRTGLSEKHISQIIKGVAPITPDTATKLERATEITTGFWNRSQANCDARRAKKAEQERLAQEVETAKSFNYAELVSYGLVPDTRVWKERADNLLSFFRVSSLQLLPQVAPVAYRNHKGDVNNEALAAWLRFGEIQAEKIEVGEFNKAGIRQALQGAKKLTYQPKDFAQKLQELFAPVGVAIVYAPYFKGIKVNGASRWVGNKAVVQLNTKGAYGDIFWFTLFHEIGHLLMHGKDAFVEFQNHNADVKNEKEKEADEFAGEQLIPQKDYKWLIENKPTKAEDITAFCNRVGIPLGVLAGRLSHDGFLSWRVASKLREKIEIPI